MTVPFDRPDPAGAAAVAGGQPSAPPRSWPRRTFEATLSGLNNLGSLWIIGLTLLVGADIVARSGFNHPLDAVSEIAAFSVVGIMFLQAAATVHSGRMTKSTMLLDWVAARSQRARNVIEASYMLLGAVIFGLIVRATWPNLLRSIDRSEFFGVPGLFTIPTWPIRLIMVVGASAVVLVYLLKIRDLLLPPKDATYV